MLQGENGALAVRFQPITENRFALFVDRYLRCFGVFEEIKKSDQVGGMDFGRAMQEVSKEGSNDPKK